MKPILAILLWGAIVLYAVADEPLRPSTEPFCLESKWHAICNSEPVPI